MSLYADWFTSANFGWFLLSTFGLMFVLIGVLAWASAREQMRREARGLPVVDADPPVSAARQAHPANGDDAVIDDLEARLHLPWHWQEDRAARRTQLTEDSE